MLSYVCLVLAAVASAHHQFPAAQPPPSALIEFLI